MSEAGHRRAFACECARLFWELGFRVLWEMDDTYIVFSIWHEGSVTERKYSFSSAVSHEALFRLEQYGAAAKRRMMDDMVRGVCRWFYEIQDEK